MGEGGNVAPTFQARRAIEVIGMRVGDDDLRDVFGLDAHLAQSLHQPRRGRVARDQQRIRPGSRIVIDTDIHQQRDAWRSDMNHLDGNLQGLLEGGGIARTPLALWHAQRLLLIPPEIANRDDRDRRLAQWEVLYILRHSVSYINLA